MSFVLIPSGTKPVNVSNTVKFLENMKGRDKAMRFIQYFSRFLAFHMLKTDPKNENAKKLQVFYKAVGLHRKAWKLGTFVDEYLKFMEAWNTMKDGTKKYLNLAMRACLAIFIVQDNLVWAMSIKAMDGDKEAIKLKSYYFRFAAAVFNLLLVVMSFQETDEKMKKTAENEKLTLQIKQGENFVGIVKNICDCATYGSNTNLIPGLDLDDGKMGLLGAISAIAGGLPVYLKLK